ncbi:serine acetyltransferase [Candidatus Symbiothrix dinenymphae]|nr:serine acetyltransferase [Candidatus Symbiothrix dinenymphae]
MTTLHDIAIELERNNVPDCEFMPRPSNALPNIDCIKELVNEAIAIFFPLFFNDAKNGGVEKSLERLYALLNTQIYSCLYNGDESAATQTAADLTLAFVCKLPEIKRVLATDVKSVLDNDPAAIDCSEVIFCYPAILAMVHYRMAHELLLMEIPLLPRIITELAHSATGIDIHPGAKIGEYFSIDHGTGVVIGETCVIGNHVRLYQGVTLGAKGFIFDANGLPLNVPRHPIIEDNVVIYSNSTILGRITIGHDSVIGGNVWQTNSVPPHSHIVQKKAVSSFTDGLGI